MKKKILIIGNSHSSSIEKMFFNSFGNLNNEAIFLDPNKYINSFFQSRFFKKIFRIVYYYLYNRIIFNFLIQNSRNDIIFFFKGENLNENFLSKIKTKFNKSKFINFNTDNPFYENNYLNNKIKSCIKYFDYYFTWSKSIKKKIIDQKLNKKEKTFYLPFGYDKKYRKKLSLNNNDKFLFYGSWDREREKILKKLDTNKIKIYGNGWQNASKDFKDRFQIYYKDIFGKNLSKKISQFKACININRPQVEQAHNMRLFEVTGYGGIIVTPQTRETNYFFKKNKHILVYKNFKDLNITLNSKFNKKFLRKMRFNSFQVSKKFSYDTRCLRILKIAFNNKN